MAVRGGDYRVSLTFCVPGDRGLRPRRLRRIRPELLDGANGDVCVAFHHDVADLSVVDQPEKVLGRPRALMTK